MNRDEKATAVKEITASLKDADSVFAFDYRGISVTEGAELRAQLREADTTFKVVKNRLAKRAVAETDAGELEELLSGPTAIAFVNGDAALAAKALDTFARQHGVPTYKGGLMDGEPLDAESFSVIARLPGVDVLRGQLVAMAASPITGLARGLSQLVGGLARQLQEIADKGLVAGTEPPPPAPEPTTEAASDGAAASEGANGESASAAEADAEASSASATEDSEGEADPSASEAETEKAAEEAPGQAEEETAPARDDSELEPEPVAPGSEAEESTDAEGDGGAADEPDPVAPGGEAEEATGNEKENES